MARYLVARADDIADGKAKRVTVAKRDIAIFNVGGEYFAISDRCPHEGASLCRGRRVGLSEWNADDGYRLSREGEFVRCPWHGWEFDLRTGKSLCDPLRTRARRYGVTVATHNELEDEQLSVESFPVTVEDRYLLVDI